MFLSVKQVAARYAVSVETVWRWVREGEDFPRPVALSPGCTRWRVTDLEAWEATRSAGGEHAA